MTDRVLLLGSHSDHDRAALEADHDTVTVASLDDLHALPEAERAQIRAIAFKFHGTLGDDTFSRLPNLGLVSNFGVGYDSIDVDAAQARGIRVTNTPDVLNDDVADLAVGMLIALSRQIVAGDAHVRNRTWREAGPMPLNRTLTGLRAGIVGLGRIGAEIAHRLAALKMPIHYTARSPKDTPGWTFHEDPVALARACDVLVVALKGGPETARAVDAEVIAALGEDGLIVNISRGSTIDEAALLDALEGGRLRGAALDVFEGEPDPDPRFLALGNVLLQPHQASATVETRAAMGKLQRDNIAAFLAGRDLLTPVV